MIYSVTYGRIRLEVSCSTICAECTVKKKQNYRIVMPQTIRYYPIHSVRQVDKRLKVVLDSTQSLMMDWKEEDYIS